MNQIKKLSDICGSTAQTVATSREAANIPVNTILSAATKSADLALNYHIPQRFVAGFNIDHIVQICRDNDIITVYASAGTRTTFWKPDTRFDQLAEFLESQENRSVAGIARDIMRSNNE